MIQRHHHDECAALIALMAHVQERIEALKTETGASGLASAEQSAEQTTDHLNRAQAWLDEELAA